jgi:4-alpha-glucanotransferase
MLVDMDLISSDELFNRIEGVDWSKVDYELVRTKQRALLKTAFYRLDGKRPYSEFEPFWLEDYALYMAISQKYNDHPWFMWPDRSLRARDAGALKIVKEELREDIEYYKFIQWLFDKQWKEMKKYAKERNVTIVGDMPIYVSWDSVEVWSRRDLFNMDADGKYPTVSGVPPDYFSEDGQRWGDPVYNWKLIKKENYKWWIDRVKHSIERYDMVRIDHFRGFANYWEIPYESKTAKKGKWVKGPGIEIFEEMEKALGPLPVIAEDLGIIDEEVFELMKKTGYPGMRVMQFGFEDSDYHCPHSFTDQHIAYTGTHDNTTMLAWLFDLEPEVRERVLLYFGFEGDWYEGGPNSPISKAWARTLFTSGAKLAVIPIQDLLGYGADTRTNTPGTLGSGNWSIRIRGEALHQINVGYYKALIKATYRDNPLIPSDEEDEESKDDDVKIFGNTEPETRNSELKVKIKNG